ncbi:TonB-dependent receptor [Pseudoalteromonas tunicata]|jgi:outer membrane receptor protein involved in Fe transport|uniref:TonB-dependent outer membrane receptor n=1 Tax=Pseudoalteromonas tunicata D2 TaxID=87626 RepID=A4CC30_9GAMM|nr:TonB-dependent receptor [Pseudoalteromonas tunicata]ATC94466.1 hypothetical protein PTUN_a1908 [Pseudoalteromonas tunicata]AXT30196.1 TonB-dependent receptor [Pseudoalteromonas tunicata]EAR27917.1 TonB-dependent outer membrane receptor [Pseudoalteromonas tunicata D2]
MLQKTSIARAIQFSLASLTIAAATTSTTTFAAEAEANIERVQITGSRILREGAIAPSPVTSISGKELLATGAMNLGEALNELPALANTYSLANSGNYIGTAGLSLLDLRGMGANRTLVLVDGKRHVSSSAGSASVDTNTIPTAWVESVEIITGGASAVYGADAVTGVVNFRLKKDITGLDVSVTAGKAEDSPYKNHKFSFSYGSDYADGRGNAAIAVEFSGQNSINATERDQTRTPYMEVKNSANKDSKDENGNTIHDGIPDRITVANTGWYDSSIAGNFYVEDGDNVNWYIFNPDGSVRPQNLGTTYGEWGRCTNCEILNLVEYSDLQPEFKRYNVNVKTNYDITDQVSAYADAKYVNSQGDSVGQPSFFEYGSALNIKKDNAYIDSSLRALMNNNGLDSIDIHRFNKDAGRRIENNERETVRIVSGVEGFMNDDWSFEAYGLHGETKLTQTNYNNLIRKNFAQSIDAVLVDGQAVCRDVAARAAGCVPTSIFGYGAVNDAAKAWFNTSSVSESTIKQTVFNASIANSSLIDLPAGFVGFAAGVEYRKEQSDSVPDEFAATGATFLNALQEEHGQFNVKEVFAEVTVPLLVDQFLIQDLVFDFAIRYADYSSIGSATSWKAGLDWTVNDEVRARSTYSIALRAPNIGELFGPQNQTYFRVNDPCGAEYAQSAIRVANCAALGIPADFDPTATASSIEGLNGGNPDLKPEESTSFTAGLVYEPDFINGFVVTVDYWSIDIDDAISAVSAQDVLDRCVDASNGIDNQFCKLIQRDTATKELKLITSISQNVAAQTAQGVDFELGYDFDAFGGAFKTKLIGTYLKSRKTFSFQNNPDDFEQNAGTVGEAQWQHNFTVAYSRDNWNGTWKTRYLSAVDLNSAQDLVTNPDPSDIMSYGSYVVTDISAGYTFDSNVAVTVGIDNLFDRDLPGVTNGTGAGTASYDNIGRFFYTQVAYSF